MRSLPNRPLLRPWPLLVQSSDLYFPKAVSVFFFSFQSSTYLCSDTWPTLVSKWLNLQIHQCNPHIQVCASTLPETKASKSAIPNSVSKAAHFSALTFDQYWSAYYLICRFIDTSSDWSMSVHSAGDQGRRVCHLISRFKWMILPLLCPITKANRIPKQ